MQALTNAAILDVWNAYDGQSRSAHALALLRAGDAQSAAPGWLAQPLGALHAATLELRRLTFGDRLEAVHACAACGELLECDIPIASLLAEDQAAPATVEADLDAGRIALRAVTLGDLEAALAAGPHARIVLLARVCGEGVDVDTLADDDVRIIEQALAVADPLADILLTVQCHACTQSATVPFDIVRYLWQECAIVAQRLLGQVHRLAAAYHWSEAEILALSPARRQFYLECVG